MASLRLVAWLSIYSFLVFPVLLFCCISFFSSLLLGLPSPFNPFDLVCFQFARVCISYSAITPFARIPVSHYDFLVFLLSLRCAWFVATG